MNSDLKSSWIRVAKFSLERKNMGQRLDRCIRITTMLVSVSFVLLISFIPVGGAQVDNPTPSPCTVEAIMAARPLRVKDEFIGFFTPGSFPDSVQQNPVTIGVSDGTMDPRSEDQVQALMQEYVQLESPEIQEQMWAVFNDPAAIAKIPSPSMRATLAGLMGTLGEPAIDYILHQTQNPMIPTPLLLLPGLRMAHFNQVVSPKGVSTKGLPEGLFWSSIPGITGKIYFC
jgi:hypothetical protein